MNFSIKKRFLNMEELVDSTVEFFSVILLFAKILKMYARYEKLTEDSEEFDV